MELKIYNQNGELKLTVSTSSSSTWNTELMTENAISASFTHPFYVPLGVNDYVLLSGIKFSINKEYKPKQKSTQEYTYSVKFYGPEHDAQRVMYLNLTDGQYDVQFSLDGSPREHLKKWVDNMNRIYGREVWSIGDVVVAPNQTIEYNNLSCWDALASIAEAFETEWWADGFTMNLSRCERGERVSLGYMQGLTSLTQSENSNDVKFFTRLIPLGSTKNIDRSRYGYSRLQLPDKSTYVDRNTQYGLYEYVEEVAFAEIFPHYTGKVSEVRTEEKTGDDGKKFTVYYFKDAGMTFDPSSKDNEIGGLVKQLSFQTGDLAGRDFEANYDSTKKEWEIINTYPSDDVQIPGGNLIPREGNTYIPWNFRMPVEYEVQAELDYKAAVDDYLAKYSEDISKYGGDTDYIYIDKNSVALVLGQNVRLLSDEYFGEIGYRDSRMTKVVRKLDNLSVATIECSNQVGKGWKTQVDSSINELKYVIGQKWEEIMIDVLKTWDTKEPSNYNVFSGLRSRAEHLSKKYPDVAQGLIKFLAGIELGPFSPGALGSGASIQINPLTGKSRLEVDELFVRMKAVFKELVIESLRHIGGELVLSPARMKCVRVEEQDDAYRCYFDRGGANESGRYEVEQEFTVGAQARCQVFTGSGQKYYWRLVTAVGDDYIDLSKTDCDTGSDLPESGDDICQLGHRGDESGMNAIVLSAYGPDAPSYKQYAYIDSYSLAGKEVSVTSPKGNRYVGDFILKTGVNIATELQILENLIKTEIQSVEYVLNETDNYLLNASFVKDMEGWVRDDDVQVLEAEELLQANSEYLSDAGRLAGVVTYDGKLWLRLKDSYVKQPNANLTQPAQSGKFYVSLRYICTGSGTLSCGFSGQGLYKTASIAINRTARMFEFSGNWDGTGDFLIQFTGDIHINLVTLTNRPLDDFKQEVNSSFTQMAGSIKAMVTSIDNINKTIRESGWLTTADGTKIWASACWPDGTKAISLFNVTPEGIFLNSSHINLKGIVTFESFAPDFQTAYEQAFGNASMTAKDDVARQLGYSNYAQLVENAATGGKAVLVGGYLNLELIDVDTLIAGKVLTNKVVTSLNGRRVEIDPETNSFKMFNENNDTVCEMTFIEQSDMPYLPRLRMRDYNKNHELVRTAYYGASGANIEDLIGGSGITLTQGSCRIYQLDSSRDCVLQPGSLSFYRDGKLYKKYE